MDQRRRLAETTRSSPIEAPLETIDLADWLFTIPDAEYQRCAPGAHIAAGFTRTDDGRPMSINVEQIGDTLIVEHYVAQITEPHRCLLVSLSDTLGPHGGWLKAEVTWELKVSAAGDGGSTLSNRVGARATDQLLAFFAENEIDFEAAAAARQKGAEAHNELETPLFAESIGRHARAASTAKA